MTGKCHGSHFTERQTEWSQALNAGHGTEGHVTQSLDHISNTLLQRTPKITSRKKKKTKHMLAKIPTSHTGRQEGWDHPGLCRVQAACFPLYWHFPWAKLPHTATEKHFSSPASSASNHIWLHWNQEGIWGQMIFICTKCLLGPFQEIVPC